MSRSAEFLKHAGVCLDLAKSVQGDEASAKLVEIGRAWLCLAGAEMRTERTAVMTADEPPFGRIIH